MKTQDITENVRKTFAKITRYPQDILTLSADFEEDLGIDSVKLSEVIAVLAEEYNFSGSLETVNTQARNIQEVVDIISNQLDSPQQKSITQESPRETTTATTPSTKMQNHLQGKVVFISSTNCSLGREISQYLQENGAKITDDISHAIDFYIENNLQTFTGTIESFSTAKWESAFDSNIVQFHHNALQVSQAMRKKGGGKIISLSSIATKQYKAQHGFIAAIHSAVECLTRYLCVEFANWNIQVNCISLGKIPPREVAQVIAQLLKQESKFINGATVVVDRGQNWTAKVG